MFPSYSNPLRTRKAGRPWQVFLRPLGALMAAVIFIFSLGITAFAESKVRSRFSLEKTPKVKPVKTRPQRPPDPSPFKEPRPVRHVKVEKITANDEDEEPRLSLGINYVGAQIGWRSGPTMLEVRFQRGQNSSTDGAVTADVIGGRFYRRLGQSGWRVRPYLGLEGGSIRASDETGNKGSGYTAGGFAGLEWWIGRRLSIGTDIGAYFINISESQTQVSEGTLDFVANSFLRFHLF